MKKSFIFGAVAAVAAVNLAFGASLANASTVYKVSKLESHNSTSLSEIAAYNGKVLELRNFQDGSDAIDIWSHNRVTGASEKLDGAIDTVGRWELAGWANSLDAEFDRVQFDGKFWLWAFDSTDENYDLFYSDGTAAGSGIVQTNQESFSIDEIVSTSDGIYFWNSTNDFPDLFFFNGTTVTAMHVTDGFADS